MRGPVITAAEGAEPPLLAACKGCSARPWRGPARPLAGSRALRCFLESRGANFNHAASPTARGISRFQKRGVLPRINLAVGGSPGQPQQLSRPPLPTRPIPSSESVLWVAVGGSFYLTPIELKNVPRRISRTPPAHVLYVRKVAGVPTGLLVPQAPAANHEPRMSLTTALTSSNSEKSQLNLPTLTPMEFRIYVWPAVAMSTNRAQNCVP